MKDHGPGVTLISRPTLWIRIILGALSVGLSLHRTLGHCQLSVLPYRHTAPKMACYMHARRLEPKLYYLLWPIYLEWRSVPLFTGVGRLLL